MGQVLCLSHFYFDFIHHALNSSVADLGFGDCLTQRKQFNPPKVEYEKSVLVVNISCHLRL